MEVMIDVLLMLIVLNGVLKLTFWPWWGRVVYAVVVAGFVLWSNSYAMLQSKEQIATWIHDAKTMQSLAVLVTMDSTVCLSCCLAYLNHEGPVFPVTLMQRLLHAYPCFLMFPAVFYMQTQLLFTNVGVDFGTTAAMLAAGVALLLPLASAAVRRLLPQSEARVESHLLMTTLVCVMGLLLTQDGRIVYQAQERSTDWLSLALTSGLFVLLIAMGYISHRVVSHLKNNKSVWK